MGNSMCEHHVAETDPVPFFGENVTFKSRHVGWLICGFFTIVSTITSFWLIWHHLTYYTNKRQQRHIVRLLLMVPIYAIVSFASYVDHQNALYYELCRDCYEAFVIASFFYLLLAYLGSTEEEQRAVFRYKKLEKWMWPLGSFKTKPSTGLHFLQMMKWSIMQYVVLRPASTLAAVITQAMGLYCVSSYALVWSHIYIALVISISVTIAMYAVVQLYVVITVELKLYSPIPKFLAVKMVVFLTFWQASALAVLASFGVIHGTKYMTAEDVNVGLNALLETFEMMIFAFLHIKAFSYRPYRPEDRTQTTPRFRSLMHAMNFTDLWVEFRVGLVYLWKKLRGQQPDGPNRDDDFLAITGKARGPQAYRSSLTAAEFAKRRAGNKEKFGVGDDGTDGEWDATSDDEDDERRRKEMFGFISYKQSGEEGDKEETTYEQRQKKIRASLLISPAVVPYILPYGTGPPSTTTPTFDPLIDDITARRLARASSSPRREPEHPPFRPPHAPSRDSSSAPRSVYSPIPPSTRRTLTPSSIQDRHISDHASEHLPEPRPVVLERYESPSPSELDRQRFGYSQHDLNPPHAPSPTTSPPVGVKSSVAEGGGGWFSWAFGRGGRERRSQSISSSPGRGEGDDGLTPAPPSIARRGRKARAYEGVMAEEEMSMYGEGRLRSSLPSDALIGLNRRDSSPPKTAAPVIDRSASYTSPPANNTRPTVLRLHIPSPKTTHSQPLHADSPQSSQSQVGALPSPACRDPRLYLSEQSPLERPSFIGSVRSLHFPLGPNAPSPLQAPSPSGPNFLIPSSREQLVPTSLPGPTADPSLSGTSFLTAHDASALPPPSSSFAQPHHHIDNQSNQSQPRSASPTNRFSLPVPSMRPSNNNHRHHEQQQPRRDSESSSRRASHNSFIPNVHDPRFTHHPYAPSPQSHRHSQSQQPLLAASSSSTTLFPPRRLIPRQIVTPTPLSPARYPYQEHQPQPKPSAFPTIALPSDARGPPKPAFSVEARRSEDGFKKQLRGAYPAWDSSRRGGDR